jgi:hypothetical protein
MLVSPLTNNIFAPLGNPLSIFGSGLPVGLISFILANDKGVNSLIGPEIQYDYVDYTYANGEVAYGDPDDVELWVDPTEQYIDENNYSTYDAVTGIGRIVSDGTYVTLTVPMLDTQGNYLRFKYTELSRVKGFIKFTQSIPNYTFDKGSETVTVFPDFNDLKLGRSVACDVTFNLSVQALEIVPPVDKNDGVYVGLGYTSLTTEAVADLTNSYPLGTTLTATSIIEEGSESKHETRVFMYLDTASNYTLQFKVRRLVGTRNLKVAWVPSGAGFTSISNTFYDLGTGAKITGSDKGPDQLERKGDYWLFKPSSISTGDSANTNMYLALVDGTTEIYQGDGTSSIEVIDIMVVNSTYQFPYIPPGATQPACNGTSGGNGLQIEMSGERPDGNELWVDPQTAYTDDNNFSSYDAETGVGRVVSEDDTINMSVTKGVLEIGARYEVDFRHIGTNLSTLKIFNAVEGDANYTLSDGTHRFTASNTDLKVMREFVSPTDVSFTLSLQKLEPYISELKECYQGKSEAVELWDDPRVDPGWIDNGNNTYTFTYGSGDASIIITDAVIGEERIIRDYEIISNTFDGNFRTPDTDPVTDFPDTIGRHIEITKIKASYTSVSFRCTGGTTGSLTVRVNSIQKLQPANMTLAALVTMGVGSDELPNESWNVNIGCVNDSAGNGILQFEKNALGLTKILKSTDGTTDAQVFDGWDRGEKHLKKVDTRLDDPDNPGTGPQFRVGNQRFTEDLIPIDSSMVYSSWITFDGSFDPLDFERWGLNLNTPMHIIWKATFDTGEIDEDTLLKLVTKYG